MRQLENVWNILAESEAASWSGLVFFCLFWFLVALAAGHAVMYKRDPRSSAGWAGLILLVPGVGAVLYWLLGINRVERKAKRFYKKKYSSEAPAPSLEKKEPPFPGLAPNIRQLMRLVDSVSDGRPLRDGNSLRMFSNGEEAYPEMLRAIERARETIVMSVYIFDNDRIGKRFAKAFKEAGKRGARVKILIDDIGARYSFPTITRLLKGENVKVKKFHRALWPWRFHYAQLRNHRKLMVVDGKTAFVGGMNIRDGHLVQSARPKEKTQDIHFEIQGPIVEDLRETFAKDWDFTAKERLDEKIWRPPLKEEGSSLARSLPNGPDETFEQLKWTVMGAVSSAQKSVSIITPYFLPDQTVISALGVAALRGIQVRIAIPEKNNHVLAHWASMANMWQVLETGCEVFLTPPPFDHSKALVVDGSWSLVGSSNWDARSFRLNFELNVECYDNSFCQQLEEMISKKTERAKRLKLKDLQDRNILFRFRDAVARLLTPYL